MQTPEFNFTNAQAELDQLETTFHGAVAIIEGGLPVEHSKRFREQLPTPSIEDGTFWRQRIDALLLGHTMLEGNTEARKMVLGILRTMSEVLTRIKLAFTTALQKYEAERLGLL